MFVPVAELGGCCCSACPAELSCGFHRPLCSLFLLKIQEMYIHMRPNHPSGDVFGSMICTTFFPVRFVVGVCVYIQPVALEDFFASNFAGGFLFGERDRRADLRGRWCWLCACQNESPWQGGAVTIVVQSPEQSTGLRGRRSAVFYTGGRVAEVVPPSGCVRAVKDRSFGILTFLLVSSFFFMFLLIKIIPAFTNNGRRGSICKNILLSCA